MSFFSYRFRDESGWRADLQVLPDSLCATPHQNCAARDPLPISTDFTRNQRILHAQRWRGHPHLLSRQQPRVLACLTHRRSLAVALVHHDY
ncbi:hypothetical protein E2C01_079011 [Portunus trituberculatus]|uniref:Uncharacterized protein n=1 Tax=Portunus trituberculatus TaxID=210409 RepID=A0A5B7IUF6_PORTR|nr:hypothetical protein [Portunus trituberculatus]